MFEKVNTGGKPLDAFELVTAMYAAQGHELRKDWYGGDEHQGRHRRLVETLRPPSEDKGILANVANTDFLQAISLFYTRQKRRVAEQDRKTGKELPAVTGNRQALLSLPLEAYQKYETAAEQGFVSAAYKGVNALLMKQGAQDFRSGQKFDHTIFFGENVDIHHIFPKDWCKKHAIEPGVFDSIINKTPLAYRTNRIIGGAAPF